MLAISAAISRISSCSAHVSAVGRSRTVMSPVEHLHSKALKGALGLHDLCWIAGVRRLTGQIQVAFVDFPGALEPESSGPLRAIGQPRITSLRSRRLPISRPAPRRGGSACRIADPQSSLDSPSSLDHGDGTRSNAHMPTGKRVRGS
jgi:hypothetical protein